MATKSIDAEISQNVKPKPIRMKLVVAGDLFSGRTALIHVFFRDEFPGPYVCELAHIPIVYHITTPHHVALFCKLPICVENYVADLTIDGQPVEAALWETPSFEDCERLRPLYYSDAHGVVLTFPVDSPQSFDEITLKWIKEIREFCGPDMPIMLVGCKVDLRPPDLSHPGFVSPQQGERLAKQIGALGYRECSALKKVGVNAVFEDLARAALEAQRREAKANGCCVVA